MGGKYVILILFKILFIFNSTEDKLAEIGGKGNIHSNFKRNSNANKVNNYKSIVKDSLHESRM